jgi:hypothetical protein
MVVWYVFAIEIITRNSGWNYDSQLGNNEIGDVPYFYTSSHIIY